MPIYEFALGPDKNSYLFPTEAGWEYVVSFRNSASYFVNNEILLNTGLIFEIIFSRSLGVKIPIKRNDPLVKKTIQAIVFNHFESKGDIPLYFFICYAGDEKEAARFNLFIKWYESMELSLGWQLYSYEVIDPVETIYCGLFINEKHPHTSIIPSEFEDFVRREKNAGKELFRR